MGIKDNIIEIQKFLEWIKTRYVPAWRYNSQSLIQQLSAISQIKDAVNDFKITTERNIRKFETILSQTENKIKTALAKPSPETIESIRNSFSQLGDIINLQLKETSTLKKTAEYKDTDIKEFIEENSKLYKPFNDYYTVMMNKLFGKLSSDYLLLKAIKYGKKYFDFHVRKPKIKSSIVIDNKKVNITVFYDFRFYLNKTKIEKNKFKGTTREYIDKLCEEILKASLQDDLKERAKIILLKTDNDIMKEFAEIILENLITVLKNNHHLLKAQNTNINVRITYDPAFAASFSGQLSSFNSIFVFASMPEFVDFYILTQDIEKQPVNLNTPPNLANPYPVLAHELGHAFDILNVVHSSKIEEEATFILGKEFTIQSFLLVYFLRRVRVEAFSILNEHFARIEQEGKLRYVESRFLRIGADNSYKKSLDELKEAITTLMTKKPTEAGKYYQEVLKKHHYEQGFYMFVIIIIDFLIRTKKAYESIIINQENFDKLMVYLASYFENPDELKKLRNIELPEILKNAGITILDIRTIGKLLSLDTTLYLAKPDWHTMYQLIIKISNMNILEFFTAYEKACDNLGIQKDLRLSAIEEIKKTQEITAKLNEKLAKQEGFLPV